MRRQQIQPYLFVLGIALTMSACFTEPNYSNTPSIDFKGMFRYSLEAGKGVGKSKRDSVVITVGFQDGDGNLGDSPTDTAKYLRNGGWGNYRIRTFRLKNGKYEEVIYTENKNLIFPDLAKGKPKGAIEGTLDFEQVFFYGTTSFRYPTKFQIQIRDRDLNVSNVVETDTITLPYVSQ